MPGLVREEMGEVRAETRVGISGMTCQSCVKSITEKMEVRCWLASEVFKRIGRGEFVLTGIGGCGGGVGVIG